MTTEERAEVFKFKFRQALAWTALDEGKPRLALWWLQRAVNGDPKPSPPTPKVSRFGDKFDSGVAFENFQMLLDGADCRPHVSPTGQGSALCPAHEDRGASLRFKDDDRLLINCRAGCETDEVLAALHTTWSELGGLR